MTKLQFLFTLNEHLAALPQEEINEHLEFYAEIIEDRMEEGFTEADAVNSVGTPQEIAVQILGDKPAPKYSKRRKFKTWEIVLLALGSPIWVSLLIAAFAVVISLYAVIWSGIVSLWAVFGAMIGILIFGLTFGIGTIIGGSILTGIAYIGMGFVCGGLSIFLFFLCKITTTGTAKLTRNLCLWIKNQFSHKEDAQ